jgi:class 3 adenylate cyclase/tetratricopeptide (TPR) repeat protein
MSMAVCANCGTRNPRRARFCMGCASRLGSELAESRKVVTALFTDIVGSTEIAARMDPEPFRRMMDRYFERMRSVVERHGGSVEKFIGDAVSCVFGIPTLREDDALRAVKCALEQQEALSPLNAELDATFGVQIRTRSAIYTGEVLVTGGISGDVPLLGNVMNIAARLQGAAGPGEILLGDETYRYVKDSVIVDAVPPLELKGLAEPLTAFRVVKLRPTRSHANVGARPLVGRDGEMQKARALLGRVTSSRAPEVLLITGPPGIGKTRLITELAREAAADSTVVAGRCTQFAEGPAYAPIAEIVSQLTDCPSRAPSELLSSCLEKTLGGITEARSAALRLAALLGADERLGSIEELGWALRKLFDSQSRDRLLMVIVEDLHWAEQGVLELIANVARLTRDSRLLVVATARPEFGATAPTWPHPAAVTRLRLEPLSAESSRVLVENAATRPVGAALDGVIESGAGNPLFLEQILATVDETDADVGSRAKVPASIQALLSSRVDSLPPSERRAIEAASIAGDEFTHESVETLCSELHEQLGNCLVALVEKDFLVPIDGENSGQTYRFRHALIREAAYQAIPRERRANLHEQFAEWLDRAPGGSLRAEEVAAHQLEQAYENRRALGSSNPDLNELGKRAAERLAAAGLKSRSRGDWVSVRNAMSRAFALLKEIDVPPVDVVRALADSYVQLGGVDALRSLADDCARMAQVTGDRRFEVEAAWTTLFIKLRTDRSYPLTQARRDAEELTALAENVEWAPGVSVAWGITAFVWQNVGDSEAMLTAARRALEVAIRANDVFEEAWGRGQIVTAMIDGRTPVGQAHAEVQDYLDWCRRVGETQRESEARSYLAVLEAQRGSSTTALEHLHEARTMLTDLGGAHMYPKFGFSSFSVNVCLGDLQTAEADLKAAYEVSCETAEIGVACCIGARLGETLCAQGRYDDAEKVFVESRQMAADDDADFNIFYLRGLAKIEGRRGRHDEAIEFGRRALELADSTDWANRQAEARLDLAEVLRVIGRPDDIPRLVREAADIARQKGNVVLERRAEALAHGAGAAL